MQTIEYCLFRVKFIHASQRQLFEELKPSEIFLKALAEHPREMPRQGYVWHIGTPLFFDGGESGHFKIGRTNNSTIQMYDELKQDFVENIYEVSPYTHVVFNAQIGLAAIASKEKLGKAEVIAARLEKLLAGTDIAAQQDVIVTIQPISDPVTFIKEIMEAYKVFRYSATFTGPNPFDADEIFQKPLAVYAKSARARKGSATISGDDLDRETLRAVTRSTAATGNTASARLTKAKGQRPVTKHLSGDAVKKRYDAETHNPHRVLSEFQEEYYRIRGYEGNSH